MRLRKSLLYAFIIGAIVGLEVLAVSFYKRLRIRHFLSSVKVALNGDTVFLSSRPTVGDAHAPVRLVEFGDYQCPPCRDADQKLFAFTQLHPQLVRFQFRNNPLVSIHPLAEQAALCAEESTSTSDFWNLHRALYENQPSLTKEFLNGFGLDAATAQARRRIDSAKSRVAQDEGFARSASLNATPTIFVVSSSNRVYRVTNPDEAISIAMDCATVPAS